MQYLQKGACEDVEAVLEVVVEVDVGVADEVVLEDVDVGASMGTALPRAARATIKEDLKNIVVVPKVDLFQSNECCNEYRDEC